ncbi:MAG: lactoylglutathione lyase [Deltaproteobacteria bacterium]|jgi:catechol 2,3-dioxygenase-like lactoylglutathione lyase family enzyme|nr:lactoylglutathione lyase [Deltaproteobacteria bacterium]
MKLKGVHHVSLNVADVEEAGRFYVEVLGLEVLPRPDFGFPGMWLRSEAQEIHLMGVETHEAPEGQHFAFRVDDIEGTIEELRGKGVEVSDPMPLPGGARQAFLRDPSGNLVEINQPAGA